jgi:hypothetical protein
MDSIGLGNAMANLIYGIIFFAILSGIIFLRKKTKLGLALWVSFFLNVFSVLYFMGKYHDFKYFYFIDHIVWPLINLIGLILLINFTKKNVKKNS